jgi:hypothetical protein
VINNRVNGQDLRLAGPQDTIPVREEALAVGWFQEGEPRAEIPDHVENRMVRIRAIGVDIMIAHDWDNRRYAEFPADLQRIVPPLPETLLASLVR